MCNSKQEVGLRSGRGIRCNVCTNCGRCPGVGKKLHILTEKLEKRTVDLRNDRGIRLITVDVGTTTIAMQLYREDGRAVDSFVMVNPQVKYGADVLSRIAAAEELAVAKEMQEMVLEVLQKGIIRFQKRLSEGEKLMMVLAANTTMVYLLMGWKTTELGKAPFAANHLEPQKLELWGVDCYIFPGLSAFVGGDIVAGIHACGILEREKLTMLIDLGTNGEIVLGNCQKLYACATAAGPAFEGGVNRGIWGADMVHLLCKLREEQLLDEDGLLAEPYFDTGVRVGDVCVTQQAVRSFQLAKAAIATGIETLAEKYGCALSEIDSVILAGGFGYYLEPKEAAAVGLLPEVFVEKTVAGGNTALAGALYAGSLLLQGISFTNVVEVRQNPELDVNIVNLAEESEFKKQYINALKF